ncbi:chlorophyllase-1 [Cannabis sativa]|uniref:Chlorophyllase n=2 Tax=Cannabis sativa TaxID=3483 RepID=A0AB40EBN3_CANSA|nr:chlorophyllase-1 [Cannabis sativa]KAF4369715.1 hypothetical protein G4B88_022113 [Cannabis sativa]
MALAGTILGTEKKSSIIISNSTDVFEKGCFEIKSNFFEPRLVSWATFSPPKQLFIVSPTKEGTYPVVLFFHGFLLENKFYEDLLHHISSHGLILVAPQLYELIPPSGPEEIESAAEVINWLEEGLQPLINDLVNNNNKVVADLTTVALAGHSRGGKAAFALALGKSEVKCNLKFSVLVGVDPVEGSSMRNRTEPHILTYVPRSLDLCIPVAVIGTGLGSERRKPYMPACAPDGLNHAEFFNECKPPCAYFVAKDFGHMDMLVDRPGGIDGAIANCMCKNGTSPRDLMRRSVGGILVAFLRAYVGGDHKDLAAIVGDPTLAPTTLDPVNFVPA